MNALRKPVPGRLAIAARGLRSWGLPGLVLAALLLAAGCGQRALESSGPPEPLTLAYAALPQATLVLVAFEKGFFAQEGLAVTPQAHPFGKPALGAVLSGEADLATVAETPVMLALLSGREICVSAVIETSSRNTALVARKDLGIAHARDLKGKTVGVAKGSNGEYFLDSFLMAQGLGQGDITLTNMTPAQMQAALLAGSIAAAAIWNPTLTLSQQALGGRGVIFYGEELHTESFCVAGSREFTRKHPAAMRRVIRALLRAEEFVRLHPEESLTLVARLIQTDPAALRTVWKDFRFKVALDQSLLVTLEDETRWAIKSRLVQTQAMPNFLEFIDAEALSAVRPGRVRIIR